MTINNTSNPKTLIEYKQSQNWRERIIIKREGKEKRKREGPENEQKGFGKRKEVKGEEEQSDVEMDDPQPYPQRHYCV